MVEISNQSCKLMVMKWAMDCCCETAKNGDNQRILLAPESTKMDREQGRIVDDLVSVTGQSVIDALGTKRVGEAVDSWCPKCGNQITNQSTCVVCGEKYHSSGPGNSGRSAESSLESEFIEGQMPSRTRGAGRLQQVMKHFVRGMLRGRKIEVVSPDGQTQNCMCFLDRRLKVLEIELKGTNRKLQLSSVQEICQGEEPLDIATPLDDLCCTLMMESGECITFHFVDVDGREQFAMCLQMLVDGGH